MNVNKPEQILGLQILSSFMKKSLGDGPAFDLVLEALIKSSSQNDNFNIFDSHSNSRGENLNSLPINIKNQEKTDELKGAAYKPGAVINKNSSEKMEIINRAVDKYSKEYDVDSKLIHAIIKQESNYNPNSVSKAGAMGLMQLMPENCVEDGVKDPFDIEDNIRGGIKQFKGYLNRYKDIEMSLMAYNAGPGTVKRRGVKSIDDVYKMPKETQHYVKKVMNYYREYSK
ncbi:lytic transglycosylase domain-containing protein [Clostridium polynesiense]|uniref:lytic transglycosylase domain-containing protein n=1 Tax=Clostridium polynesiense TaxID=1325933 RepID=UPI00058F68C2|nr:lytic transglycosylase domain-containing protein [Clostridium polynesiense]